MVNIIKQNIKSQKNHAKKFIWGFPLLTFVMAFIFTLGMTNAYAESVWNWWYTLLLPGMIALFVIFLWRRRKDKILSFNDYSHRQKKIVAGENYLYWVHDFVF